MNFKYCHPLERKENYQKYTDIKAENSRATECLLIAVGRRHSSTVNQLNSVSISCRLSLLQKERFHCETNEKTAHSHSTFSLNTFNIDELEDLNVNKEISGCYRVVPFRPENDHCPSEISFESNLKEVLYHSEMNPHFGDNAE